MARNGFGWITALTAFSFIAVLTSTGIAVAATGAGQYSRECQVENWPHEPFASGTWKKTPKTARYQFVQSLLGSPNVTGKSREYIIDLLGPPDGNYKEYISYVVREFGPVECIHGFIALLHFDVGSDGIVTRAFVRLD